MKKVLCGFIALLGLVAFGVNAESSGLRPLQLDKTVGKQEIIWCFKSREIEFRHCGDIYAHVQKVHYYLKVQGQKVYSNKYLTQLALGLYIRETFQGQALYSADMERQEVVFRTSGVPLPLADCEKLIASHLLKQPLNPEVLSRIENAWRYYVVYAESINQCMLMDMITVNWKPESLIENLRRAYGDLVEQHVDGFIYLHQEDPLEPEETAQNKALVGISAVDETLEE